MLDMPLSGRFALKDVRETAAERPERRGFVIFFKCE
jgi:hypothetical protein